jgi:uncharacterized protein (TIGR00106 family)
LDRATPAATLDAPTLQAPRPEGPEAEHGGSLLWQAAATERSLGPGRPAVPVSPRRHPVIVAFSISPAGHDHHVGDAVAECVRIVRESGLPNETNAMFTNIEGDWDECAQVVGACIRAMEERGAGRVSVVMKVDHLVGDEGGRLSSKVESVERRLREGGS